jgi:hypothetical protein
MKKALIILAIAGVVVVGLGVAGYAYAQEKLPPDETFPFGFGFRGGRGGRGAGMSTGLGGFGLGMMGWNGQGGVLHDYLLPAFVEAFDLTDDQLAALQESVEIMENTLEQYEPGSEELSEKMQEALNIAVENAVDDEIITQEQGEWILERKEGMSFGPGNFFRQGRRWGSPESLAPMLRGSLQEYIQPAIAEAFDLTTEELEAIHEEGETLWQYAEGKGMTLEEFRNKHIEAFTNAVNAALENGAITQTQADWMLEHQGDSNGVPFGPGRRGPRW